MNNPMNSAVRKIHNLLSSGAVTVTGPNQPRILKQKVGSTTVASTTNSSNNASMQQQNSSYGGSRCYVCDDAIVSSSVQHQLTEMHTSHSNTKFPNKIGQLVGDAFMVIVSVEDVVCSRCTNLINYLDRLENDVERVRTNIMNLLHKKYGLNDDGGGGSANAVSQSGSPPTKMQKLNSGNVVSRMINSNDEGDRSRKGTLMQSVDSPMGKQSPPVSAVQQIKISTPQSQQTTHTIQRKTTKIYKCLSCDYKTSDMRLFNTHYETCKQQNFQCKNCKKIFPNFGAMKQHMIKDHNTPMDNTCAVCHINFVSDQALRKHMEINHSTNVVVTSSTTIPAAPAAEAITPTTTSTPLYTCNHCQFKSTDKPIFNEHMRKHMSGTKPKPFKCRLCSQRFETREQATVHAKQHQPNYFKCGTCSMSFSKRELLVKHFEVHQQQRQPSPQPPEQTTIHQQQQQQQTVAQTTTSNTMLTTQKLLQETIDEALSESVAPTADTGAANANIRFFSCHICSLTFIQENYYNQHMETHKREKKTAAVTTTASSATLSNSSSLVSLNSASALLSDGLSSTPVTKSDSNLNISTSAGSIQHNSTTSATSISEADIESIFEKMHSDKGDGTNDSTSANTDAAAANTTGVGSTTGGDNLVITSQAGSGGITFNITIPQPDGSEQTTDNTKSITTPTTTAPVSVSIDMPMLDQPDEPVTAQASSTTSADKEESTTNATSSSESTKQTSAATGPVSMPSLDDDNDAQEHQQTTQEQQNQSQDKDKETHSEEAEQKTSMESTENSESGQQSQQNEAAAAEASSSEEQQTHMEENAVSDEATNEQLAAAGGGDQQVTMELDEAMQAQVEGGQIKFILNENGQLLQLDNHIITDAEGNQILVQDPEQIQQLLQSVGVLQSGDGLDGETLQMMTDGNGQMVLVQGDNNETQLIDASLLNADGQLVIQQGQDGDLSEGAHVIGEDGTRIPVSVSYTADGQPIVQVQQQVLETAEGQQILLDKDSASAATDGTPTSATGAASTGSFFALEDLMQQSSDGGNAKETD